MPAQYVFGAVIYILENINLALISISLPFGFNPLNLSLQLFPLIFFSTKKPFSMKRKKLKLARLQVSELPDVHLNRIFGGESGSGTQTTTSTSSGTSITDNDDDADSSSSTTTSEAGGGTQNDHDSDY